MGNLPYDGNYRVFVVDTVANISAPTVTEITAGTEITEDVPKNGWNSTSTDNTVDTGNLSTLYESEVMGTHKMTLELTVLHDPPDNTSLNEFRTHGQETNIVVLPYKGTGDVAADDECMVFPVETGKAKPAGSEANTRQSSTVRFAITAEPELDGTVVV